ncbi:alpha/beta hydrolase [Zophobihabitans entericus]|uniref:Alpha/beta hydrolase n=1 Tax=Zophobihabitans entericus TaxID=1635327 RepID=A0A6G9IAY8_9GAMM|nr:alpha/beta hydrolase [Zophobihabitans entericus]QIQ21391.1 alpha/beta hydrolase [Zophobihabitans entericus]
MTKKVQLEQAAAEFSKATSTHPFLFELPPAEGRKAVNSVQDSKVFKHPVTIEDRPTDLGKLGKINVRIIKPEGAKGKLPVYFYIHGAGWVFGNAHTHDKLVRELAVRTNSVVVFPEYSLSPEAKYPTAINQCYAVLEQTVANAAKENWDVSNLIVSGDSVGGNMATVMTIMAKQKNGPKIKGQVLFYPVTDASFETGSYNDFATDYFLYKEAMKWFWDQYTTSEKDRNEITASPLRATIEQLKGLPEAIILNGEADVLRDEGEAYARKLREAGVPVTAVRFQAMIHDFVMLNPLDQTKACRAAMDLATAWVNQRNK